MHELFFELGENLIDIIEENLIAERIAVEHCRNLIRYFADNDTTTRVMLEGILGVEEEHANELHDLLVARDGTPMLKGEGFGNFRYMTIATERRNDSGSIMSGA